MPADWTRYAGMDFGAVNTAAVYLAEERDRSTRAPTGRFIVYREYPDREFLPGKFAAEAHAVRMLKGGQHAFVRRRQGQRRRLARQVPRRRRPGRRAARVRRRGKEFYKGHEHPGDDEPCAGCRPGWFCVGTKKDVPKHCECLRVGHYCGVYVWVPPEGQDELTKLTLAILDYAFYDPKAEEVSVKQVTAYFDADNKPTTEAKAVKTVVATVSLDSDVRDTTNLLGPAKAGDAAAPPPVSPVLIRGSQRSRPSVAESILGSRLLLDALAPSSRRR
jgi:hypothetical protein